MGLGWVHWARAGSRYKTRRVRQRLESVTQYVTPDRKQAGTETTTSSAAEPLLPQPLPHSWLYPSPLPLPCHCSVRASYCIPASQGRIRGGGGLVVLTALKSFQDLRWSRSQTTSLRTKDVDVFMPKRNESAVKILGEYNCEMLRERSCLLEKHDNIFFTLRAVTAAASQQLILFSTAIYTIASLFTCTPSVFRISFA